MKKRLALTQYDEDAEDFEEVLSPNEKKAYERVLEKLLQFLRAKKSKKQVG